MAGSGINLEDLGVVDSADQCRRAADVVLDVALGQCSADAAEDVIARLVGLDDDVEASIANAPDELEQADCLDIQRVRAWVAKRAINLIDTQEEAVTSAVTRAWAEANDTCGWG